MTLGMSIGAAAVYYFLVPSKLIIGSISGLSIVISTLFDNFGVTLKVSHIVIIINAILLVIAWFLIGHEFGAKTVYTALILGPLMDMWEAILPYENILREGRMSIMNDPWLDLVCFVLLVSISQAILFNINASTGGLDILAKIVNKYLHFDIGVSVTVAGALICCTAFAINPFDKVVLGLIGTWINGMFVDHFTVALNRRKRVCIISDEYEKIRKLNELDFAVRVDQQGNLLRDWHNAKSDKRKDPYTTNRYYLEDAVFVVAISHQNYAFIQMIEDGLRSPYFQPFMGRRACPLPVDFIVQVTNDSALDSLKQLDWQAATWYMKRQSTDDRISLEIYTDSYLTGKESYQLRQDKVLSFSQKERKFGFRYESRVRVEVLNPLWQEQSSTEHDIFNSIGD